MLDDVVDDVAKKTLGVGFWIAVGWLGVLVVTVVFAPFLPLADPDKLAAGPARTGPIAGQLVRDRRLGA